MKTCLGTTGWLVHFFPLSILPSNCISKCGQVENRRDGRENGPFVPEIGDFTSDWDRLCVHEKVVHVLVFIYGIILNFIDLSQHSKNSPHTCNLRTKEKKCINHRIAECPKETSCCGSLSALWVDFCKIISCNNYLWAHLLAILLCTVLWKKIG